MSDNDLAYTGIMGVICPECGTNATVTKTKFGRRDNCCGLRSWDGKPLTDEAAMAARRRAHAAFDPLWKQKTMPRSTAYALLTEHLELGPIQCHMASMDLETALKVPGAVNAIILKHKTGRWPQEQSQ